MRSLQTTYSVFLVSAPTIHGGWSRWSPVEIDHCSCSGTARQDRRCTNPPPSGGGDDCLGSSTRYVDCDECRCNNGGCVHICKESYYGRRCSCFQGYKSIGTSCIGMWILRLNGCSHVSLPLPWSEKGFFDVGVLVGTNNRLKRERGVRTLRERLMKLSIGHCLFLTYYVITIRYDHRFILHWFLSTKGTIVATGANCSFGSY